MRADVSFVVEIVSDNDAMVENPTGELTRVLKALLEEVQRGTRFYRSFRDINGNDIGYAELYWKI